MNYHPFIMIVDDNFSEFDMLDILDITDIPGLQYDHRLRDMDKFLIILISYWELFIQGINLQKLTPFGLNGTYLLFKNQYNDQFDHYEEKQLLETEIILQLNNCLEQQKYAIIKKINRSYFSDVLPKSEIQDLFDVQDKLKQIIYSWQKSFLDAISYYNQLKNMQNQIFIDQQDILPHQYYIHQFKVQKMFLEAALVITNNQIIFDEEEQKQLKDILSEIIQQPTQLKEPILKNYKIQWTQKEFIQYQQELYEQQIYSVTEEQTQQLDKLLVKLRSIPLTNYLNFHDFTVVYYKYNFIIKCLLHFERLIYFDDYDLHFDRVFKQLNISKLKIDWVELILKSNEIILY